MAAPVTFSYAHANAPFAAPSVAVARPPPATNSPVAPAARPVGGGATGPAPTSHVVTLPDRFRTTMCRHMQRTGSCAFGAKCNFAHDPSQLRSVSDNRAAGLPSRPRRHTRRSRAPDEPHLASNIPATAEQPVAANDETPPELPLPVLPVASPAACDSTAAPHHPRRCYQHTPYAATPLHAAASTTTAPSEPSSLSQCQ